MNRLIKTDNDFHSYGKTIEEDSKSVACFGKDLNLSSGSNYFLGENFMAELFYWADDYNSNEFIIWKKEKDSINEYMKARVDLAKRNVYHTDKTFEEFMKDIKIR